METFCCINCNRQWQDSGGVVYSRYVWKQLDVLFKHAFLHRMKIILAPYREHSGKDVWVQDVCGRCVLRLARDYLNIKSWRDSLKVRRWSDRSDICSYGHKRTKYNCNTCRKEYRKRRIHEYGESFRIHERMNGRVQYEKKFGEWAPAWRDWLKLKREVKSYGKRA